MTSLNDVRWGSYQSFSGPWVPGSVKYELPENPTAADQAIAVVTSTEGGHFDSINAYDRCIVSVGLLQYCEAVQYSTSNLLGKIVVAAGGSIVDVPLLAHQLASCGASFKPNAKGQWRFFMDAFGEVDTLAYQQALFLKNSDGKTWDDESKAYAKQWAATLANVLAGTTAQKVQAEYTLSHLMGFVLPDAYAAVFRASSGQPPAPPVDEWEAALRAAYLSFAANNPTIANNQVKAFFANAMSLRSRDVCIGLLKQLTFGPKVTIYPARYNAIRPVLEKLYNIDLPDFSAELAQWQSSSGIDPNLPEEDRLETVLSIQQALIKLGFDIGPSGADGKMGPKTRSGIMQFQLQSKLAADGSVGPLTRAALVSALHRLSL